MKNKAFTLIDTVIALSIMGILSSIAYAPIRDTFIRSSAEASTETLRAIEVVKRQYAADHPRETEADYLELRSRLGGQIPTMPRQGETIVNLCDLTKLAESSFNGNPAYEPWGGNEDTHHNGYGDLGNSVRPAVRTDGTVVIFEGQKAPAGARIITVKAPAASTFADLP